MAAPWDRHRDPERRPPLSSSPLAGMVLVASLVWIRTTDAQRLYQAADSFPLDAPGGSHAVDDFDGDGRPDVAVTQASTREVRVFLSDASTLLAAPTEYEVGLSPVFVTSGDVNSDGSPDLFVVNSGAGSVSLLLNRGNGTFALSGETKVGLNPRVGALADFSGDGHLDAVVTNLASRNMDTLVGDGRGGFRPGERLSVGDNPHSLAVGDFDDDRLLDVAIAHREEANDTGFISWFRGLGDGSFRPPVKTALGVRVVPRIVVATDLNQDGHLDLATLTGDDSLLYLRNVGTGTFERILLDADVGANAGFLSGFLVATDFDEDGLVDLVSPTRRLENHGIRVHRGLGGGTFESRDVFLDHPVASFTARDMDGDGVRDAIVTWTNKAALATVRGLEPGRLRTRTVIPLPTGPRALVTLHVRNDGTRDLVVLSTDGVHMVPMHPAGTFGTPVKREFEGSAFQDMVTGDFDGDGLSELALSDLAGSRVVIAVPVGAGDLDVRAEHPVTDLPARLATGDFDRDGITDLAVADQAFPTFSILFHPGIDTDPAGVDARLGVAVGSGQTAIAAGELDGDGLLDLVVATRQGVRILSGDGRGRFPRRLAIDDFQNAPSMATGDLDDDGRGDLVVVFRRQVIVLYGVMTTDPRRVEIDCGTEVRPLRVHDIDGDGLLDILTANSSAVLVARGTGAGTFDAVDSYRVGAIPNTLLIGFLDADRRLDCATADFGSRSISILHGAFTAEFPGLFRRGDVDGTGSINITDPIFLLRYLFSGGRMPLCADAGDGNDDGSLDVSDLVVLLTFLFQGQAALPAPGSDDCGRDPTEDELPNCRDAGCL